MATKAGAASPVEEGKYVYEGTHCSDVVPSGLLGRNFGWAWSRAPAGDAVPRPGLPLQLG